MELSQESILKRIRKKALRPLKIAEMARNLSIPEPQRKAFRNLIKEMAAAGKLIKIKGSRYGLPEEMSLVTGSLMGHSGGFGFVTPETPDGESDVYIHRKHMKDAMHQDRVVARVHSTEYNKREGQIVQILERKTTKLTGLYENFGKEGWVVPTEDRYFHDIFIPARNKMRAQNGHLVEVEIVSYPTSRQPPIGKVTHIIGFSNDPEAQVKSIFRKHDARLDFPEKVLRSAESIDETIPKAEFKKRKDLTGKTLFTIDGAKAKDFDDAVSLDSSASGYRLGVHIADVAHYVLPDQAIDKEAYERATSIYYPDGVIPMLPFRLSNNICSLKPDVERLAVSAWIDLDPDGVVTGFKFFNSVIKSCRRLTYSEAAASDDPEETPSLPDEIRETLMEMKKLSRILRKKRFKEGSVDFQIPEAAIVMSEKGTVEHIGLAEHNWAHEMIEEFMLCANRCAARFLKEKEVPAIHRIHEEPDAAKISALRDFIKGLGIRWNAPEPLRSVDIQKLVEKVRGRPEERVINVLLLRSMKKAIYSPNDIGHYCLGFPDYVHFTSPIRRYPDLATHRLIKTHLTHKCKGPERRLLLGYITECAGHTSWKERKAMEIERDVNDLRQTQYMADKTGKHFEGYISGVQSFGFFVELKETLVEGLVRMSSLTDDYYIFMEAEHKLQGQRRHQIFKIGDSVEVRVVSVDIAKRRIDLALVKKL
ncbi:MAG: ribonuclease R [Candidatus Nitrohelix vancouverensis]|uniref:Ribonuclease R n=1 Tax=Candidatus Nitrohelix vancouverensis TaxID=2705534 RepID=A0A7T0C521_9BACT|nr:MAG: ribonuclease R [Candidatus Nitrohelix vancouverensis]